MEQFGDPVLVWHNSLMFIVIIGSKVACWGDSVLDGITPVINLTM